MQGVFILSVQDLLESLEGVAYVVAQDGTILACGGRHWTEFALTNDGESLADRHSVIGSNLFDFIRGRQVKDTYRALMDACLAGTAKQIAFGYRCDGPEVKREMRLSLSPVSAGQRAPRAVLFHALPVSQTARPRVDLFDPALRAETATQLHLPVVAVCSCCQEVRWPPRLPSPDSPDGHPVEHERWVEVEEYYGLGGGDLVRVTHAICPRCERQVFRPLLSVDKPAGDESATVRDDRAHSSAVPPVGQAQPNASRMAASGPTNLPREAFSTRLHG